MGDPHAFALSAGSGAFFKRAKGNAKRFLFQFQFKAAM
jgi:hypothetical protein